MRNFRRIIFILCPMWDRGRRCWISLATTWMIGKSLPWRLKFNSSNEVCNPKSCSAGTTPCGGSIHMRWLALSVCRQKNTTACCYFWHEFQLNGQVGSCCCCCCTSEQSEHHGHEGDESRDSTRRESLAHPRGLSLGVSTLTVQLRQRDPMLKPCNRLCNNRLNGK